jgi:hypothetical protein
VACYSALLRKILQNASRKKKKGSVQYGNSVLPVQIQLLPLLFSNFWSVRGDLERGGEDRFQILRFHQNQTAEMMMKFFDNLGRRGEESGKERRKPFNVCMVRSD